MGTQHPGTGRLKRSASGVSGRFGRRRLAAVLAMGALLGSGLVATEVVGPVPPAAAEFATGGSGQYPGLIDWFSWGAADDQITSDTARTNTRTVAGQELATTCELSEVSDTLRVYRPGAFTSDGLDDLYNIGGTGASNTLAIGLANFADGANVTFDFSCAATLDGDPVPLAGLVMADAEASGAPGGEYIQASPDQPATWRIIDRIRDAECESSTQAVVSGDGTLRFAPTGAVCATGPMAVAFMEGATSAAIELNGGGVSAIALGVVLGVDFGDAPASYGQAGALIAPSWTGGEAAVGTTDVFGESFELATPTPPSVPRLGATVDAEAEYQESADATGDGADEDGIAPPATLEVARGGSYTLEDVECTGPGAVAGWIDWNGDGEFDAGERSDAVDCEDGSVDLTWTVPDDALSALGEDRSFLRLRIGPDAASLDSPTGLTTSGEVEDYAITIDVEGTQILCPPNAPGILFQGGPSQWYNVDLATGEYDDDRSFGRAFNAIGYNQFDGFIYGYVTTPDVEWQIVRIGDTGGAVNLGRPAGVPADVTFNIGDVDENGQYWLAGGGQWFQIDLASFTVQASGTLTSPEVGLTSGADWAYVPGGGNYLYRVMGSGDDGVLVAFDRVTHEQSVVGTLPGIVGAGGGSGFGAVYADANGYLYASNNGSGYIYRIDVNAVTATLFAEGPVSGTNDGARCANSPIYLDFGDAPASYGTTLEDDGPRHTLLDYSPTTGISSLMLGVTADPEDDGIPSAGADSDSDDGVVGGTISATPGQPVSVTVTVTNDTGAAATFAGWVDLNGNGAFEASERVVQAIPATPGAAEYELDFPALATASDTFARFRVFPGTVADPSPLGAVSGGEVEDHPVQVLPLPLPAVCSPEDNRAIQRYWFFGQNGAIDFGTSGTTATAFLGAQTTVEGSTVVTDTSGNLQFWSNGQTVFDRNSAPMPNGTGLLGNPSATQTVAAFPSLGSPGIYFVVTTSTDVGSAANGQLSYSVVDMTLNGGLGAVTATKNVSLGAANTASEAITAVPNAAGDGFWVLSYTNNSPNVLAYEFDATGPVSGTPVVSAMPTSNGSWYGSLAFSADYTRMVQMTSVENGAAVVRVLGFDAASGAVFEDLRWNLPTGAGTGTSGYNAEFSPGGDFVYATKIFGGGRLYRYDISDATTGAEVKATEQDVGPIGVSGGQVRRAPDGRMYVANHTMPALSVVNDPDAATDPDFAANGFPLPTGAQSRFGLPQTVTGCPPPLAYDFGDAPASYGTLLADDGPRHAVPDYDPDNATAPIMLGSSIDIEDDGQPTSGADGDDTTDFADEDGVVFNPSLGYATPTLRTGLDPETLQPVENTVQVEASADGFVSVWVDWNRDGDFDDAGEQLANAQAVTAGLNEVSFEQGDNPDGIFGYVRVRYSTDADAIATPYGPAPDGEVEDYRVLFERLNQPDACVVSDVEYYAFTFEQPVETTGTGGPGSSARYENVSVIDGVPVDMVVMTTGGTMQTSDAPPNGFGVGGGALAGVIDEDDARWQINTLAQISYSFYEAGTTTPVAINGAFTVNDMDGPPAQQERAILSLADLAGYGVAEGSQVQVSVNAFGTTVEFRGSGNQNGGPESRFQIVLEGIETFTAVWFGSGNSGFGFDGDGDLGIQPPACSDFGDAPDSYGTTLDADGARHLIVPGLRLGTEIDFDPDGQPTPGADGDDTNRLADEDGVATPIVLTADRPTSVTVSATNSTADDATLAGWIDLDGDGTFDADELVTVTVPAGSGTQDYVLEFPAGDPGADSYARFRLFPEGSTISPIGAADGGEVEDYPVTFLEVDLDIEKTSTATADSRPGDVISYTVTAENTGTGDFTAAFPAIVSDDLSGVLDDASYAGDATATIDGADAGPVTLIGGILSWSGPLASGETLTLSYTVTLGSDGDGEVRNVAWGGEGDVPECDPPVGGIDPETGQPCAENSFSLPRLTVEKSSDVTDLPSNGGVVVYTITVTNTGDGDYTEDAPATVTDDLTEVLDDAEYQDDAAAEIDGTPTTDPSFASPVLEWSGPLASGEVLEISYTVVYDDSTGDNILRNVVCLDPDETAPGAAPCDFVQIPGAGLTQWKQAEPSDVPTAAGSTITYTLFFANDGEADAAVDVSDDLTHVLDDAEITTAPTSPDGLLIEVDEPVIGITGLVPPGETHTVSYVVTVLPDGERGDDIATNFLLEPGEDPPTEPDCVPTDGQFPDCTTTLLPAIEYEKSVEASSDPIGEGTVLSYTITVRNTGAAAGTLSKVDDLSGVLDDAELTTVPSSDVGSVIVSSVVGGVFSIGGTLPADGEALISYEVTVLPQSERGDGIASNFLLDPGQDPPEDCEADDPLCTTTELPFIESEKSVDPASGTSVSAGDELSYTLFFENTGDAAGAVDYTDLLGGIIDDGAVSDLTVVSGPLDAALVGDDEIRVTGLLPAGATATISYIVTVGPDGERGDNVLGNFLVPTGDEPPEECAEDDPNCTSNPIAEIVRWKTVTPSETPVRAGTVLSYNVFIENRGEGAGDVDLVDDLTHVLDDGDVTVEPSSSVVDSPRTGEVIAISGTVPGGVTAVVSYQVTIREDGDRGDDNAANFLLEPGEEPPAEPGCEPADDELPDCTTTGIGHLVVTKAVEASTDPIDEGTVLSYTLTFENVGSAPVAVDKVDDLSGVLDDATLDEEPTSSDAALTVTPVVDDAFTVTGTLESEQIVTVEYSVIVNPITERGDDSATNFVLDPGEDPPAECDPAVVPCTVTELPRIVVTKSVVASSDPVVPGTVLSYTITFENLGLAAGGVDKVDDLSGVLDDAELTTDPVSSDPAALQVSAVADEAFSITGTLEPEELVTVEYEVTVSPDTERGDSRASNFVLDPGQEPPTSCDPELVPCTETDMPEIHDRKEVAPVSGTPVVAGQELVYTLTFRNDGTAAGPVDRVDDLTHLVDDAELIAGPEASDPALTASGPDAENRIAISGTLAPGQEVTVSYTLTVRALGERGDDILANYLLDPAEEPPVEPICEPEPGEEPDCTFNEIGEILPLKSSDPASWTEVASGSAIEYTLSFENIGQGAAAVDFTDYLAGVLDDARLAQGPTASDGLSVTGPSGDELHVTGTVAGGATATVSYTVVVLPYAEQGDHRLGNFLVPDGFDPPTLCDPDNPLCTWHEIPPPPPGLSLTGTTVGAGALLALLLLAGGLLLVSRNNRRRDAASHRGA